MYDHLEKERETDATIVALNEARSMTVFCHGHPLAALRPRLAKQGIVTAVDLRRIPSGRKVKVTGLAVIVHMPPTKSGKRVIFTTLEDETGLIDLVVFPKAQKHAAKAVLTCEVQTVEGRLQRQGKDGLSISIVVERVIPHLTGRLSDLLRDAESDKPSAAPKYRLAGRREGSARQLRRAEQ